MRREATRHRRQRLSELYDYVVWLLAALRLSGAGGIQVPRSAPRRSAVRRPKVSARAFLPLQDAAAMPRPSLLRADVCTPPMPSLPRPPPRRWRGRVRAGAAGVVEKAACAVSRQVLSSSV